MAAMIRPQPVSNGCLYLAPFELRIVGAHKKILSDVMGPEISVQVTSCTNYISGEFQQISTRSPLKISSFSTYVAIMLGSLVS